MSTLRGLYKKVVATEILRQYAQSHILWQLASVIKIV